MNNEHNADDVSYRLSADQLLAAVPGSAFSLFPDIRHFTSIDALLGQSAIQVVFLLYEFARDSGHFCCVFRRPTDGAIEFFDPYGCAVDHELAFVQPNERIRLHEDSPWLLSLLVKGQQTESWTWNSWDLQRHDPRIQDCGRWCILRALHRDLDDSQFHAFIRAEAKKYGGDFDRVAVALTAPLL